ncbi:hypothetical protein [Novosphingobium colocasiae]|uniref:Uncharacterized protein n=1 Tax=Novosphingobium colocasiae TaxID=1256513 RepID=A0A918PAC5_9SPHN|nr:hypothetical protein [Novosphingobium colocasiae]GGY92378.1 hypothetical protein GCM10011614_03940 [Novosphingobium colocasiae]
MAFYDIDLSTRMGAESAVHMGGVACFVFAAMSVLGIVIFGGTAGFTTPEGIGGMIGIGLQTLIGIAAGFRLRAGKGLILGMVVAVLLVLEIVAKIMAVSIFGTMITIGLMVMLVNGLRGARALRNKAGFAEDEAEVFY